MVIVESKVNIGQSLRLHALRCVNDSNARLASGQRSARLIIEVNTTGRIDKIQLVLQAIRGSIGNAHGLRLDCNAAFPFKVHLVKVLLPGFRLQTTPVSSRMPGQPGWTYRDQCGR